MEPFSELPSRFIVTILWGWTFWGTQIYSNLLSGGLLVFTAARVVRLLVFSATPEPENGTEWNVAN